MKTIVRIDQLSLPELYKETLMHMIAKLQEFPIVKDAILFGSCARQDVSRYSDIDLALIVSEPMSPEEEWNIDYSIRDWNANLVCDVIFLTDSRHILHRTRNHEGVFGKKWFGGG